MNHRLPFTLCPHPRSITVSDPELALPMTGAIAIPSSVTLFEGRYLQNALARTGRAYDLTLFPENAAIAFVLADGVAPQGYTLSITPDNVRIVASGVAGLFYGVVTLCQMLAVTGGDLPCVQIDDSPDFPNRGYMLDISRDRVPTRETLLMLIDELAALKYNQLQLYTEHTFAYPGHETVWKDASPLTSEDLLLIEAACRERHIELVPNQNSLGHVERWLKHEPYRPLAEAPDGFTDSVGLHRAPSTLDPQDPLSLEWMRDLYDKLLPHFSSRQFNVGCDEPWELGEGKSRTAIAQRGGRVYLDWIVRLHADVTERGRTMMFWGDIILHYPDLVPELPEDVIVMEWGYEASHPFDANCARYAAAGIPFYVCPGTSSWNSLVGRADNTVGNIRAAVEAGFKHGAIGVLNTDWGDRGHWQPYPVSYTGMVYGAAAAWGVDSSRTLDLAAALDQHVYHDRAGVMGRTTLELANLYQRLGQPHINGHVLAYMMQEPMDRWEAVLNYTRGWSGRDADVRPETLDGVIARINTILETFDHADMDRSDAAQIVDEWRQAAALLRHSARYMAFAQGERAHAPDLLSELDGLIEAQARLWRARSRPGGLADSLTRFDTMRAGYIAAITP